MTDDAPPSSPDIANGQTHRIVFTPSGLEIEVSEGTTVLDAARAAGVDLDSTCGGRGLCGRCQISQSVGSFAKWAVDSDGDALSGWTTTEDDYRGRRPLDGDRRLGCAARVRGNVVIEVPADSQVHRPVVRKSVELGELDVDPLVHLYYVELAGLAGADRIDDLRSALRDQHGVAVESADDAARQAIDRLDAADIPAATATVAVRRGDTICGVVAGYSDDAYGVAVDVGSTTIAGHLVDLASGEVRASHGVMNPQIRFGDDLMSRVSYVMMNPGGERELTAAVRQALDEVIETLCVDAGVGRASIFDMVVVGNPIMHHLVLGLDPTPLGQAPFPLATDGAVTVRAADLDIGLPFAETYLLPCIAGHVGADTAAVILSEGPHRGTGRQLLVDVGTNAEIVFGDAADLWAASSPTGPAFEGAQISAGQRATAGAIERVRIDRTTLEPRIRVIGASMWSDDPQFDDAVAATGVTGICGSGIIEVIAELFLAGVIATDGTIRGELAERTARVVADGRTFSYVLHTPSTGPEIRVTQDDVRAVQLAKAALRAGIDLLLERADSAPGDVASVRLAGAFGAHLDPLYVKVLGLVPDVPVERVRSVGNAAGAGAVRALLSRQQRSEIERTVAGVEKVETAIEPRFQELFVDAMGIPHTTVATPNLAAETALPPPSAPTRSGGRSRTRRRS